MCTRCSHWRVLPIHPSLHNVHASSTRLDWMLPFNYPPTGCTARSTKHIHSAPSTTPARHPSPNAPLRQMTVSMAGECMYAFCSAMVVGCDDGWCLLGCAVLFSIHTHNAFCGQCAVVLCTHWWATACLTCGDSVSSCQQTFIEPNVSSPKSIRPPATRRTTHTHTILCCPSSCCIEIGLDVLCGIPFVFVYMWIRVINICA